MSVVFEAQMKGLRKRVEYGRAVTSVQYRAYCDGGELASDVETAANAYFPTLTENGLVFSAYELTTQVSDSIYELLVEFEGRGGWYDEAGSSEIVDGFEFDTTGGTRHTEVPIQTPASYGPKKSDAALGVVGFNGREIHGIDVPDPSFQFSITRQVLPAFVTAEYVGTLKRLTGKVNNAPFNHLEAGEVLFLGARGTRRGREAWTLTWKFSGKENRSIDGGNAITIPGFKYVAGMEIPSPFVVGDLIHIEAKGWDVLDVVFETVVDDDKHTFSKQVVAAYVRRVLEWGDFAQLGL